MKINQTKRNSYRESFVYWMFAKVTPLHNKLCGDRNSWNLSPDDFLNYPEGSLGNELGKFYRSQNFEPISKAERHDVFHVLLGYSTNVIDEGSMQFFLWGNGKISIFTLGAAIGTAILFPNRFEKYQTAFMRGKQAVNISKWNFKNLLKEDTSKLKSLIFKDNSHEKT